MRKTNKRYYGKDIKEKANLFLNREIDIVTNEGRCYHVVVDSVDDKAYYLTDFLQGKHQIPFDEIDEIIDKIEAEF
ncbi:hypothetical protein [Flammeovirga pacifica]|uniref:Uncharacterized protein n=1 Tax=Flammeovirga pacifica TaxID=915059 RepID=A0A1S1YZB9_FLAPC|nr:hypothetical protein [Flammeovirga pacifica]OHX66347.1 hypothetical protein NH26_08280 [Flammeovirga pacifica]